MGLLRLSSGRLRAVRRLRPGFDEAFRFSGAADVWRWRRWFLGKLVGGDWNNNSGFPI